MGRRRRRRRGRGSRRRRGRSSRRRGGRQSRCRCRCRCRSRSRRRRSGRRRSRSRLDGRRGRRSDRRWRYGGRRLGGRGLGLDILLRSLAAIHVGTAGAAVFLLRAVLRGGRHGHLLRRRDLVIVICGRGGDRDETGQRRSRPESQSAAEPMAAAACRGVVPIAHVALLLRSVAMEGAVGVLAALLRLAVAVDGQRHDHVPVVRDGAGVRFEETGRT